MNKGTEDWKEAMANALVSDKEIEACGNLTPLEKGMLSPIAESIGDIASLLATSVNKESGVRFLLAASGIVGTYLHDVENWDGNTVEEDDGA